MNRNEIQPGRTYIGGKNGERRTVIGWGRDSTFVSWAPTAKRLPYGGFVDGIRVSSTESFAKWATSEESTHDK